MVSLKIFVFILPLIYLLLTILKHDSRINSSPSFKKRLSLSMPTKLIIYFITHKFLCLLFTDFKNNKLVLVIMG